jgi:hypothetical protein
MFTPALFAAPNAQRGPAHTPFILVLTGEVSGGFDGSTWFGGRLGGCVRLGPVCAGLLTRVAFDPGFSGDAAAETTDETAGRRFALDGLAFVDFPITWSKLSLVPGVGIGGGWVHSMGYAGWDAGDDNLDTGTSTGGPTADSGGFRVDAHLSLLFHLRHRMALELSLDAGVSIPAHTEAYTGDGRHVAGEPLGFVRGGLGLVWGVP